MANVKGVLGQVRDVRLLDTNDKFVGTPDNPLNVTGISSGPTSSNTFFDVYVPEYNKGKPIYMCTAEPGTLTSQTGWQVCKMKYVNKGKDLEKKRYANGSAGFIHIADDYASFDYIDI
jgi:hypothetical protein